LLSRLCTSYSTITRNKSSKVFRKGTDPRNLRSSAPTPWSHCHSTLDVKTALQQRPSDGAREHSSATVAGRRSSEPQKITPPPSPPFFPPGAKRAHGTELSPLLLSQLVWSRFLTAFYGRKGGRTLPRPTCPARDSSPRGVSAWKLNRQASRRGAVGKIPPIRSALVRPLAREAPAPPTPGSSSPRAAAGFLLLPATQAPSPSSRGGRPRLPNGTLRLPALLREASF
jgi:hypothetical protein